MDTIDTSGSQGVYYRAFSAELVCNFSHYCRKSYVLWLLFYLCINQAVPTYPTYYSL